MHCGRTLKEISNKEKLNIYKRVHLCTGTTEMSNTGFKRKKGKIHKIPFL